MDASDFWAFQAKDWITLLILFVTCFAVYIGPIRAVKIARKDQQLDLQQRRKDEIFSSLMKTRRVQLDPEHVAALNLVQVYFKDVPNVITTYKIYIRLLSREIIPGVTAATHFKEQDDGFVELMHEMAKSLNHSEDKKELAELAYSPLGWANDQETVRKLHKLLVELLENKRGLSISPYMPQAMDNFPPPPQPRPNLVAAQGAELSKPVR